MTAKYKLYFFIQCKIKTENSAEEFHSGCFSNSSQKVLIYSCQCFTLPAEIFPGFSFLIKPDLLNLLPYFPLSFFLNTIYYYGMQTSISSEFFIPREGDSYNDLFKRVRIMPLYSFPHIKDMNCKITEHRNRFFAHMDFDAFYAQVEQRDNPKLRGKAVSVGGTGGGKGIVMTASYEARARGVDTGMSVMEARRICPELISLPCPIKLIVSETTNPSAPYCYRV